MPRARGFVAALGFGLLVAACGGSDDPTDTSAATPSTAVTTTTAGATATTLATSTTEGVTSATEGNAPSSSSVREMRADFDLESIVLQPADEGGPHPTLAWDSVDGAATYWLVVRDGSGQIYWAWTGADTSVRVGGGDRPELNQTAALYEPMTWSVAAIGASGNLVALSDTATVSP